MQALLDELALVIPPGPPAWQHWQRLRLLIEALEDVQENISRTLVESGTLKLDRDSLPLCTDELSRCKNRLRTVLAANKEAAHEAYTAWLSRQPAIERDECIDPPVHDPRLWIRHLLR